MEKEEEPQPGLKIEGPTNYPETSQPSIHSVPSKNLSALKLTT